MSQWTRRGFFIQHATAFRSLMHLDLYRGRVDAAWAAAQCDLARVFRAPCCCESR